MVNFINFSKSIAFKFYLIIVIASVLVLVLGVDLFGGAKQQMLMLSNKNKVVTTQNLVRAFDSWLGERTTSLQTLSRIIQNASLAKDETKLNNIIRTFWQTSGDFDAVQFLRTDGKVFINGETVGGDEQEYKRRLGLIWYVETKTTNEPSINFMPHHTILEEPTINICVPNHDKKGFVAVLCGIVKLTEIFQNVKNFDLPPNVYTFIVTHAGEVLTPIADDSLRGQIQSYFAKAFLTQSDVNELEINSNFISFSQIPSLNWFIGAGADDAPQTHELVRIFQSGAVMLFVSFVLLVLVANSLHSLMYRLIKRKNDEYEILLAHKAKMSEAGELISGINHQFIQPVNSLNLMISTLLMLEREGNLDRQNLREILHSGEGSVRLMRDTIDIFRNFYKASEDVEEFSLRQSIKNLLTLMHTELSRANVSVVLGEFDDVNLHQRQNVIQQILLILLHNAKDALLERYEDISRRKIDINVQCSEQKCFIRISEFGGGVSDEVVGRIFSEPRTTKSGGNGIGLYFGRKLARQKLGGDLRLINAKEPTIFELSFLRKI